MANIRFSKLVEHSGEPEVVTLWVSPETDSSFQKAIRENRVLTVQQKNVGIKKDVGVIGFEKRKSASYLVFPKALAHAPGIKVVGIKYDLISSPPPKDPIRIAEPARRKPEPKAVLEKKIKRQAQVREKTFVATVRRTAVWETTIEVTARDKRRAEIEVKRKLSEEKFSMGDAILRDQIRGIDERGNS
jgi:hypothetical protein